jgi:arabinofuranosyltransferase
VALRTAGRRVVVEDSVGYRGFFAGPGVHIVDRFALCDPLLARLAPLPGQRIGHFARAVPDGYVETLASGTNRLSSAGLAAYYDRIRLIVAGPIWSLSRFKAMVEVWFRPIAS